MSFYSICAQRWPKARFISFHFVLQLILDRHDFFPLNRALSLTNMDDDSTESKIDELLQYVLSLVQKQKEEVSSQI